MGRRRSASPALYEKDVQAMVVDYWRTLGLPNTLVAAIPNAGAMGQPGLTAGLPDLLVLGPRVPGGCSFIELKRDRQSHLSDAQRDFGSLCEALGIRYMVCVGAEEPIRVLENWVVVRLHAA
jgi:hypothetical protein